MKREIEIAKRAARGAAYLVTGKIISYLIGLIGTLAVIRLLTPSQYGVFSVALVAPGILGLFSDWGVGAAVTKRIAGHGAEDDSEKIKTVICSGFVFKMVLGATLSIVCYLSAEYFAYDFFHKPETLPLIRISSLMVFASSLYGAAWSAFIGFERMHYNSAMMICYYSFGSVLMPLLVVLGYSVIGAVVGYVLSPLLAGVVGILALMVFIKRNKINGGERLFDVTTLRRMLGYGVPLALGGLISVGVLRYYDFMIASFCVSEDIGNYVAAGKFSVILDIVTSPVTLTLFPAFSKFDPKRDIAGMARLFNHSVKYTTMLVVPVVMGVMALSSPMTRLFFGYKYTLASRYLLLKAVGWLYYGLGMPVLTQLFAGQGETRLIAKLSLITVVVGGVLAYVLVPRYGIVGLIVTMLMAEWPSYIVAMRKARGKYGIGVPIGLTSRTYVASAISTLPVVALSTLTNLHYLWKLIGGILVGASLYLVILPKIGAIKRYDAENLKTMFGGLPYIGGLVKRGVTVMERLM